MGFLALFQRDGNSGYATDADETTTSSTQDDQEDEVETQDQGTTSANISTYVVPKKQPSILEDAGVVTSSANISTYVVPKKQPSILEDAGVLSSTFVDHEIQPSIQEDRSTDVSSEDQDFLADRAPVMMTREGDGYVLYFLPEDHEEKKPMDVQKKVAACCISGPLARVEGYYDTYHCVAEWFFKIACATLILFLIYPAWYFHATSFTFFSLTLYNEFSCILDMDASREKRHWSSVYSCCLPLCVGSIYLAISYVPIKQFDTDVSIHVDGLIFLGLGLYLSAVIILSSVVYWFHDHRFLAALVHYGPVIVGIYLINGNKYTLYGVGCILFEMIFGAALSIVPTWKSDFTPGFHEHIFHSAGPTTIFCNILLIMYLPLITMGVANYVFLVRCVGYVFLGMTPFTYALWKQNPLAGEFLGLHADFFTEKGFKRSMGTLIFGLWHMIEYTFTTAIYIARYTLCGGFNSFRDLLVLVGYLFQGIYLVVNKILESIVWCVGQLVWEICCLIYAIFHGIVKSVEAFIMCLVFVGENSTGDEVLNAAGIARPSVRFSPPELMYIPPVPVKPLSTLEQYEVDMIDFARVYGQNVADVAIEVSHDMPVRPKVKQPSQVVAEGGTREEKKAVKKIWREYEHKISEFARWYGHIYGQSVTMAAINAPEMPASLLYYHYGVGEGDEVKKEDDIYSALHAEERADKLAMVQYLADLKEWNELYNPPICSCVGFQMKVTDKIIFSVQYLIYVMSSVFEHLVATSGFMVRSGLCCSINSGRDIVGLIGKLFQCIFKAIYDLIAGIFWFIGQITWGVVMIFHDLAMGIATLFQLSVNGITSCYYSSQHCLYPCYPYGSAYEAIISCFSYVFLSIIAFFGCIWDIVYTIITAPFICIYDVFRCVFGAIYSAFSWCYNGCSCARLQQDCTCCVGLTFCNCDCLEGIDCPENPLSGVNRRLKKCCRVIYNNDIESKPVYEIVTSIGGKKITDKHPKALYKSVPISEDTLKSKRVQSKTLLVAPWASKSVNVPPQSKPPKGQLVRYAEYEPINASNV